MGWICCGTPKSKTLVPSAGTAIHSAIQFLGVSVIQNLWWGDPGKIPVLIKLLYFVWSPPWHLYICYWQIFWHSIWHIFWHSIWHIFWHSIWHIFWHIIYSNLLAFYLANILTGTLSGISFGILSGISSGILSGISSNILSGISPGTLSGISYSILSGISSRVLSDILSGISSGILSGFWGPAVRTELGRPQVEVQRCALSSEGPRLRSSGAHWAGKVPGWGPAVRTELGRSQVEVQRCALSWEGPRLRSSSAHWAGKVPGVEVQQCALSSEVGEELGEELVRRKRRWKLMQTWSRRNWRRRRRRRRTTALIKSNNPHLAGGEWQTLQKKLARHVRVHSLYRSRSLASFLG